MSSLLRVEHVTISYNGKPVVQDVSFELKQGEILGDRWRVRKRQKHDHQGSHGLLGEDLLLDPGLHAVGELVALSAEDLDAVVLIGVVTGGDHDARVRLFLHGEIATAGVGMVPTGFTSLPTEQSPAIRADSSMSEEMRVSLPITTVGRLPLSSIRTVPTACPTRKAYRQ